MHNIEWKQDTNIAKLTIHCLPYTSKGKDSSIYTIQACSIADLLNLTPDLII
jgi:hypothetical protein